MIKLQKGAGVCSDFKPNFIFCSSYGRFFFFLMGKIPLVPLDLEIRVKKLVVRSGISKPLEMGKQGTGTALNELNQRHFREKCGLKMNLSSWETTWWLLGKESKHMDPASALPLSCKERLFLGFQSRDCRFWGLEPKFFRLFCVEVSFYNVTEPLKSNRNLLSKSYKALISQKLPCSSPLFLFNF